MAFLRVDPRETEEYGVVVGDAVVIRELDGTEKTLWSIWDHPDQVPMEYNVVWESGFYPDEMDWSHANDIRYDSTRNSYTLSFRNLNSIMEIHAETGEILRLFGELGDYELDEDLFGAPHGGYWTSADTLLFFTTPQHTIKSKAVELRVDDKAKTAEVIWEYGEETGLFALVMGSALRHENGNTLINYGSGAFLEEVSAEGDVVWDLISLDGSLLGNFFGHTYFIKDLYSGADMP